MNDQRTWRALIASGSGRYADPWHPFAETSVRVAALLTEAGFETVIVHDVEAALSVLDGFDLLVVNAGDPWRSAEADASMHARAREGLTTAIRRGVGIVALHSAVATLRDHPDWAAAIGAVWIPGSSTHPPFGTVAVEGGITPGGAPIEDFVVDDERYVRLQQVGPRTEVAWFDVDGERAAAAWTRTHGHARVAVDVLGHDARSYDSRGHRAMLLALAEWAADPAST